MSKEKKDFGEDIIIVDLNDRFESFKEK